MEGRQRRSFTQITASMSRKADCFDNAPMESFFHTLKTKFVSSSPLPSPR